jgi:hypothetical protein
MTVQASNVSSAISEPALMFNELTFRRTSMVRLKHVAASAILSAVIANPAFAQAVIQEPGAYAKNYPTADLAIGAPLSSRMAINKKKVSQRSGPRQSATASRASPIFRRPHLPGILC